MSDAERTVADILRENGIEAGSVPDEKTWRYLIDEPVSYFPRGRDGNVTLNVVDSEPHDDGTMLILDDGRRVLLRTWTGR